MPTAPGELIEAGTPATPDAAAELIDAGTPATPDGAAELLPRVSEAGSVLTVTGTLSDGTDPVVFPPMPVAAEIAGSPSWQSGDYTCVRQLDLPGGPGWALTDGNAIWVGDADGLPQTVATWTATSPATGTPTVTLSGVQAPAELIESGTPQAPDAPGELI